MKEFYKLFLILCLLSSFQAQAQKFTFEATPPWVYELDTLVESKVSQYDIISGAYVSIADYQLNLAEDASYRHEITNVVSFSGITNASQLAVTYDTSYQELKIHHLYILRNGKRIDRTKEIKLEVINNEQSLHLGIYTGQITAYSILEDIRKDDRIDFAYSLIGNNPIFEDEKFLLLPLESFNPIDYLSLRVIYPTDKNYAYECVGCTEGDVSDTIIDGFRRLKVEHSNTEAIEMEDMVPTWFIPYNYFILSSNHSWREVYDWAEGVFELENEPDLDEVFAEVFTGNENMDDKIDNLINFVQDDIRYMGIESGIGSIKPFPPGQVVNQRFGDCKDKSLLLVTLLNKIGVELAYPALVNTMMQHNITSILPGVEVFDHCIVYFEHNDTGYWVDPSVAQQGGSYKNIANYDYGKALIVGRSSDSLQEMNIDSKNNQYTVTEEYTMTSFFEPASVKIESKRTGLDADQRRMFLQYISMKEISDQVSNDLGRQFPVVEQVGDFEVMDDPVNNIFINTYYHQVDGFWIDGDEQNKASLEGYRMFRFEPVLIYDYLNVSSCNARTYPAVIPYPMTLNYNVIFHFPDKILIDDAVDVYENEAFYYEESIEQINKTSVQLSYKLKTLTNEISAANYPEICKQKKELRNDLPVVFYFFK